jgi:hypothetical protein
LSDEPAVLCPRCHLSETQGGQNEQCPIATPSAERARGKPGEAPASAPEAIRAFFRDNAQQSHVTPEEVTAAFCEAIRSERDGAKLHGHADDLGVSPQAKGKSKEAVAEFDAAIRIEPGNATAHNSATRVRWLPGNAGSAGNGEVWQGSRPRRRGDLERRLHKLNGEKCPICKGPGPIDVHRGHVAWSIAYVPFWSSLTLVCCRSCGVRLRLGAIAASIMFGLWAIPFCWIIPPLVHSGELGWIMTPVGLLRGLDIINFFVQVARNLRGVFFAPARQRARRPGEAGGGNRRTPDGHRAPA